MFKLGAITVGQSPRTDVTDDIMGIFQGKVEILERGALDGLTVEDIDKLAPDAGEYVLVSRMRDGSQVSFSEQKILPRIQECIEQLEAEGVKMILFFCTGEFDYKFKSRVPLIFPCDLISRLIPVLCGDRQLIVVTPTQRQVQQSQEKWRKYVNDVVTVAASHGDGGNRTGMQKDQRTSGPLVAMDCIGYSFAEAGGCRKNREDSGSFPHHGGPGDIGIVRYLRPDCELRKGKKTKMYAHQGHKCIQRRQKQKESCIMHIKT